MKEIGVLKPKSREEAQMRYDTLRSAAQEVLRTAAKQMEFGTDEYQNRVTDDVIDSAHDALFASLLTVQIGTRDEYETATESVAGERVLLGNENVGNAAWHTAPLSESVVAATYENQPEAAAGTVRRQAFGRIYREVVQ